MATAGSVVVNLVANTGQFTKKIGGAKRTVASFGDGVSKAAQMLKRFGAMTAVAAASGVTLLTKRSYANIDAIAKMSDRLGVSTEFLSAFGHAATLAGASQETFTKGIQFMLKNIGEANMGLKSYQDAFTEIGVSYKEVARISPEQAFIQIAKKLNSVKSEATRMSVAMRIFGRSGSMLLNMMDGDLDGVIDRMTRLGITFDRDMARKVEDANDAMTNLRGVMVGLGNTIAIDTAPAVKRLADYMTELGIASRKVSVIDSVLTTVFNEIGTTLENFADIDKRMSGGSDRLTTTIEAWAVGFKTFGEELQDGVINKSKGVKNAVSDIAEAMAQEIDLIRRLEQDPGQFMKNRINFSNLGLKDSGVSGPESFTPSAREIDTSQVSVAGLAMSGKETILTETKKQTDLLNEINYNTRKMAGQEMLN